MAGDRRRSTSSKNSVSDEPSSFVHVTVNPIEEPQNTPSLGSTIKALAAVSRSLVPPLHSNLVFYVSVCVVLVASSMYAIAVLDLPFFLLRITFVLLALFAVSCLFYWFALIFRKSWSDSCAYVLFCACVIGEVASRISATLDDGGTPRLPPDFNCKTDNVVIIGPYHVRAPELIVFLLTVVSASSFNSLSKVVNGILVLLVTFIRFFSYTVLVDLPIVIRPYVAYVAGMCGIIVAKHTEIMFNSSISTLTNNEGKLIAVRRRKTSTTLNSSSGHSSVIGSTIRNRRTSLPALSVQRISHSSHIQSSNSSLDITLLSEAHGLISDMLADKATLPPHIISGLQALSNLLSPPNYISPHQQRQRGIGGAVVSLTDFSGSDTEENLPYTGERPSALPKRFKKNVPQSLLRRMSTSTWTTTTSATGMPTLEPEPCRKRSTSFRNPPELSPTSGMSNSLSLPSSMSNAPAHSIPIEPNASGKSRSFSTTATPLLGQVMGRKGHTIRERERKTVCSLHPLTASEVKHIQTDFKEDEEKEAEKKKTRKFETWKISDKNSSSTERLKTENTQTNDSKSSYRCPSINSLPNLNLPIPIQGKAGLTTSDYDSCESPSGSDTNEHTSSLDIYEQSDTIVNKDAMQWIKEMMNDKLKCCDQTDAMNNIIPVVSISSDHATDVTKNNFKFDLENCELPSTLQDMENYSCDQLLDSISEWDYPIFELQETYPHSILSKMCHRVFLEVGLFETFKIPMKEFLNYFHTLEGGYREKPYHNSMHAADVLHAVYHLTSQAIPGFIQIPPETTESDQTDSPGLQQRQAFVVDDTYGVMGANVPALELMALYTAAAMHDYDHPGRTNAFLVTTNAPLAVLYNDRSVLENHHAAAAWSLFLSKSSYNFLKHLDKAEFKRFRFLVIEFILATDLKRHFEILTEFNAKVNIDEAPGINWQCEADRMLVMEMCIKLADINGPCKQMDLHTRWTKRIAEEFYEQGDEELLAGLPVSPFMDRNNQQLAKLQESFINHLVAPLCNAYGESGLLPGLWVESCDSDDEDGETTKSESECKDTEDEGSYSEINSETQIQRHLNRIPAKKITCLPAKHIQDNYDYWIEILKEESKQKEQKKTPNHSRSPSPTEENFSDTSSSTLPASRKGSDEMETIHEEELNIINNHVNGNY